MSEITNIIQIVRIEKLFSKKKLFWNSIDSIQHKRKLGFKGYNWGEHLFIPVSVWIDYFNKEFKDNFSPFLFYDTQDEPYFTALLCSLMSVSSWRYSMGCYYINDYLRETIFNENCGSVINISHIRNIKEWSIYIALDSLSLNGEKLHGAYVHTNNIANYLNAQEPDILILSFNVDVDPHEDFYTPMPCIVLDISKDSLNPLDSIISSHGLSMDAIHNVLPALLSVINVIGDEQTAIESDFVGLKRPSFKDIETNLNFNEFNIPTLRLIAPSNTRKWKVGLNYMTEYKSLVRQNPSSKVNHLHWVNGKELRLVQPHLLNSSSS